ncbi:hypothetical protein, partial [Alkalilimnicola ehrlichii]
MDQFLNRTDDQRLLITEGATNTNGQAVYGAAHQDSGTMFVDIASERIGSLVNTVAHEGMHLTGAGEANATVTGYMTDLAYRVNAWANKDAIENHRPAPVAIQDPAAHQALLNGNNAAFRELDNRGELEHRQLNRREASLLDQARANIANSAHLSASQKDETQDKLNALACAAVNCAAGVSKNDPHYDLLQQLQAEGEALQAQGEAIHSLLQAYGLPASETEGSFTHGLLAKTDDFLTRHENKVAGLGQATGTVAGATQVTGGTAVAIG